MIVDLLIPELTPIQGGEFRMGDDNGRWDERPAHVVTVASFRAGVRPVTNAEYSEFIKLSGGEPPPFINEPGFADPKMPAAGVNWHEATDFCRWLAKETGIDFRLPTEAEREYSARGGLGGADWPWGDRAPDELPELEGIRGLAQPHRPSQECTNAYGLLCMADNVHEWCSDWYDAGYYSDSPSASPRGPSAGRRRTSRGGSWRHQIKFNRVSARSSLNPDFRYNDYGFRVYADA